MTQHAGDLEEIRRLAAEYNWHLDAGEVDAWVECFSEDGEFSCVGLPADDPRGGTHKGREALHAYGVSHYAINKGRVRHWNWNILIDIDGDNARMRCYMNAFDAGQRETANLRFTGFYHDRLRRTGHGWRFTSRQVTLDPA